MSYRLAAALTAGTLTTGLLLTTAPAASAASKVNFCFEFADGRDYANKPVLLRRMIDGKPVTVRRTLTDSDGCGSFVTPRTDRRYWVKARYVKALPNAVTWYAGRTPETADRGTGTVDLGTGTVKVVRAISAAGPLQR
jgi:hypothetical protein